VTKKFKRFNPKKMVAISNEVKIKISKVFFGDLSFLWTYHLCVEIILMASQLSLLEDDNAAKGLKCR
jgi:hypothetical protein